MPTAPTLALSLGLGLVCQTATSKIIIVSAGILVTVFIMGRESLPRGSGMVSRGLWISRYLSLTIARGVLVLGSRPRVRVEELEDHAVRPAEAVLHGVLAAAAEFTDLRRVVLQTNIYS